MNNLEIAIHAAKSAAKKLKKIKKQKIQIKSELGKDIKLEADSISENAIIKVIKRNSPYPILSEESSQKIDFSKENILWIIDPLDGSLNFSRDIPFYCISISLWKSGNPVLGVVYDIVNNNLYHGEVNVGAFCNNKKINCSIITSKKKSILATGFPVYSDFSSKELDNFIKNIQEFKKIRLFGSAAMSIINVAKGSIEAYCENDIAIWDVAGALAILKAAGGKYNINLSKKENVVYCFASNGISL